MAYDTITQKFTGSPAKSIRCWCSIEFAIPESLFEYYQRQAGDYALHCPLGHEFVPSKPDARLKELEAQIAKEKRAREWAEKDAKWQRDQRLVVDRQNRARKGVITRIKNRVKHGVCPCCTRTFQNLARHMEGQHPDWSPEKLPLGRPRADEAIDATSGRPSPERGP